MPFPALAIRLTPGDINQRFLVQPKRNIASNFFAKVRLIGVYHSETQWLRRCEIKCQAQQNCQQVYKTFYFDRLPFILQIAAIASSGSLV